MKDISTYLASSIGVAVIGQIIYHVFAKSAVDIKSPFELVAITYIIAFFVTVLIGISVNLFTLQGLFSHTNFKVGLGLGISVALVEIGYIYSYRYGLPISTGAISVLAITTLALIPIGFFIFSEVINIKTIIGTIFTALGIWLIMNPHQ